MASSSEQKMATIVSDCISVKILPPLTAEHLQIIQDENVKDLPKMKAALKSQVHSIFAQYHAIDQRLPQNTTSVTAGTDYTMKIKYGTVEKSFVICFDRSYADLKRKALRLWEEDDDNAVENETGKDDKPKENETGKKLKSTKGYKPK
ncbi:ABCG1, partial [Symbiodinium sp. KB8]